MSNKPVIATVLRSGGAYTPSHVKWLKRQLPDNYEFVCFSDKKIKGINVIPLTENWPGWWSKIELFNPSQCSDDIFFLDLDTVVVGDITDLLAETRLSILADFYHPNTVGSAVMMIPRSVKAHVWEQFIDNPEQIMRECTVPGKKWGDQGFLDSALPSPVIWQEAYPGQITSYKQHIATQSMPGWHAVRSVGDGRIPSAARLVCFHGFPKPWESGLEWVPNLKG